jgi:hypothetical protein
MFIMGPKTYYGLVLPALYCMENKYYNKKEFRREE